MKRLIDLTGAVVYKAHPPLTLLRPDQVDLPFFLHYYSSFLYRSSSYRFGMDMQSASTAAADKERQPLLEQDVNKPKKAAGGSIQQYLTRGITDHLETNAKPNKQRSTSQAASSKAVLFGQYTSADRVASVTVGTTPSSAAVEGKEAS